MSESKFSVGDRVRLVKVEKMDSMHDDELKERVGEEGNITVIRNDICQNKIKFDDGNCYWVSNDEIELVNNNNFNIGDEVVTKFEDSYAEGVIEAMNTTEKEFLINFGKNKYWMEYDEVKLKSELEKSDRKFKIDDIVTHKETNITGKVTGMTENRLNIQTGTLEICDDMSEFVNNISFPDDFEVVSGDMIDIEWANEIIKQMEEDDSVISFHKNNVVVRYGTDRYIVTNQYYKYKHD